MLFNVADYAKTVSQTPFRFRREAVMEQNGWDSCRASNALMRCDAAFANATATQVLDTLSQIFDLDLGLDRETEDFINLAWDQAVFRLRVCKSMFLWNKA